jgi:hypothetical protein
MIESEVAKRKALACARALVLYPGASESEAELAVGRLPAALPLGQGSLFGSEIDGWAGKDFVDVTAHDAAAIGAMPVALDDHRAAALRTRLGWGFLQSRHRYCLLIRYPIFGFEDREKDLEASYLLARPSSCRRG